MSRPRWLRPCICERRSVLYDPMYHGHNLGCPRTGRWVDNLTKHAKLLLAQEATR